VQFQVPQFIETEDKIIGPLTLRQFLYLAAAGAVGFALFFFLSTPVWLLITSIFTLIMAAFAFIKVNGRPLSVTALAALSFYWKPRLYLWERKAEAIKAPALPEGESKITVVKSKINDLWDQLKTSKQPVPKREKPIKQPVTEKIKTPQERYEVMQKITGEKEKARRIDYR